MYQQRNTAAGRMGHTHTPNESNEWVGLLRNSMIRPDCVLEVGDLQGCGIRFQTLQVETHRGFSTSSNFHAVFTTHTVDCNFSILVLSKGSDVFKSDTQSAVKKGCHFQVVRPILLALSLNLQWKTWDNVFYCTIFNHKIFTLPPSTHLVSMTMVDSLCCQTMRQKSDTVLLVGPAWEKLESHYYSSISAWSSVIRFAFIAMQYLLNFLHVWIDVIPWVVIYMFSFCHPCRVVVILFISLTSLCMTHAHTIYVVFCTYKMNVCIYTHSCCLWLTWR